MHALHRTCTLCYQHSLSIFVWLTVLVSLAVCRAVRDVVAFLVDGLLQYAPSERLSIRAASSGFLLMDRYLDIYLYWLHLTCYYSLAFQIDVVATFVNESHV